ncbi:MAG TPA: chitobiase/beta-hexosaminidase C-terminal domain-containing protein, partial [Vicinamibacterales bacterium]|nr:chitobiase/beta-hexosaminidase C-terminal domain-containing protein [Vicinamibacterales bacterium]
MFRWLLVSAAWVVVCAPTIEAERNGGRVEVMREHVGPGSIAAGAAHTVLATPEGRVYAWGAGERGQLGDGALTDRWTPTPVPGVEKIVGLAAGTAHTVALSETGEVFTWGANTFGVLGDASVKRSAVPIPVAGLRNIRMIAAGDAHTLALDAEGHVYAWGANTSGQLGHGKKSSSPTPVVVADLHDVVAIAAGAAHSLAVTRDGRLYAWGRNDFSALGDGTTKDRAQPVAVALSDVADVAAGGGHSLALLRNGTVYSWGRGANGELGTGSTRVASTPAIVEGVNATDVAAGRHFSAALLRDGQVAVWGANGSGQIGDGTTERRLLPSTVSGLSEVVSIALGASHAIAVTATGDVRTWGEGESGRLGGGSTATQDRPVEIMADVPDWGEDPGSDRAPAPPSIDPQTGIYPAPQLVTITPARTGDIVRYTLTGLDPDQNAPAYSGPFVVGSSSTVLARSFSPIGLQSDVRAATYTIDTTPPTIVATATPPVHDGWVLTPVTVTFECADNLGVAFCPGPVVIAHDTTGHIVSGTVVDVAGHTATASVTVNVDTDPPALTIESPQSGASFNAATIMISGRAVDPGSGIAQAGCN